MANRVNLEMSRADLVVTTEYSARGIPKYRANIWHKGLNEYKCIAGSSEMEVRAKAEAQLQKWSQTWKKQEASVSARTSIEQAKAEAQRKTSEAEATVKSLQDLLFASLFVDLTVDWESLKDRSPFVEPQPKLSASSPPPRPVISAAPNRSEAKYRIETSILDRLSPSRLQQKKAEAENRYLADCRRWTEEKRIADSKHANQVKEYEARLQSEQQKVNEAILAWKQRKAAHERKQSEQHARVESLRTSYAHREVPVIEKYCEVVLYNSKYPDCLPKETPKLDYDPEQRRLIVEYTLPLLDNMPSTKQVRFVQSRQAFETVPLSNAFREHLYESVIYQIALRTISELFASDVIEAFKYIVFNGWVTYNDSSTGHQTTSCLLSLQAERDEFTAISLSNVEPKACFRKLKGISASKLASMAAVAPILQLDMQDTRFVNSYQVANRLDQGTNLAAIPWEDFEHLVRELFESEFSSSGGEVKVTQASRDGGVDAVAFDPDPVRGGKTVIQAKRYTNTVGVSAVRDLYGTVINEGAMKGILVTTSDYGPDAYEFAKGKPLTLLSGSNLLSLLERHGHKAYIDLREAKEALLYSQTNYS